MQHDVRSQKQFINSRFPFSSFMYCLSKVGVPKTIWKHAFKSNDFSGVILRARSISLVLVGGTLWSPTLFGPRAGHQIQKSFPPRKNKTKILATVGTVHREDCNFIPDVLTRPSFWFCFVVQC